MGWQRRNHQELEFDLADHVGNRILAGHLPPGTKLGEEMLSGIFAIPRSKTRRILQMLADRHLVELVPNRGAFIARPNAKEARDILAARRVIESVTTEIAARTILTHRLRALAAIVAEERLIGPARQRERIALAGDFHRSLAQCAHNAALTLSLEPLILRTALVLASFPARPDFSFAAAHARVLDAIEAGRSYRARLEMERCLFAIEASLDLTPIPIASVNVAAALSRLG
ncbi:MAG: GntR family transcriptional regulator [Rhodovulum sulfidophilum]|uniref:GntR family transcriptional regulator n=1 Tax=Rhodovulum sulfidophilum TaxID=35806 RepID=A0A2W5N0H4_RHOSU|nr:MAG: GntR family transcriptional regulator [Rhodovulum sulfidophilum]